MLSGTERTKRYEERKRAAGMRKVHVMVPQDRAEELKAIASRMRAEHSGRQERKRLVARLQRERTRLRARGILGLSLFGSMARNEATRESDIDLLAELDPAAKLTLLDLIGVEQDLEKLLGRPVDLIDRDSLSAEACVAAARDAMKVF
jgi:predicted nucleotidyltransferase